MDKVSLLKLHQAAEEAQAAKLIFLYWFIALAHRIREK